MIGQTPQLGQIGLNLLAQEPGTFWLPPKGSTTAGEVDWLFAFIFYISAFFFLLIVTLMIFFVIRFRRRPGAEAGRTANTHLGLELTWTIIPVIIVVIIFYLGFTSFMEARIAPPGAREIQVTAQKWSWFFTYLPSGYVDSELHVPVNEPVKLVMTSEDVIHSLYIPAFRLKMDLVPGRYSKTWFQATEPGSYVLYCTEYCGTGHSDMISRVVVHKPGEFERWLERAGNWIDAVPPAEAGKVLVTGRAGCTQCHSIDGKSNTGPTFKGLFNTETVLADGRRVAADENYVRESILEPAAKVVAGFQGGVMPTYKGRLKDQEITAIIAYLKTLAD